MSPSQDKTGFSLPKNVVLPNHIAIIPDGNRRWARARGFPVIKGHEKGFNAISALAKTSRKFGIHTFTVWGFSTENWSRDEHEVSALMELFERMIDKYLKDAQKEDVRIVHLGRKDRIPKTLLKKIENAEKATQNNQAFVFNVALDYGGHDELVRAARELVVEGIKPEEITPELVASHLDTGDQPYPYVDLLIRTSGEQRLSGFLPWQLAYSEIWWDDSHLPDFDEEKLVDALMDYSRRRRRFGGNDEGKRFDFVPRVIAKLELDWWRMRRFEDQGGFTRSFAHYVKEQFGITSALAKEAAELFAKAAIGEHDPQRSQQFMTKFYDFIKDNVSLAFEPKFVASLELEYLKKSNGEKKLMELQEVLSKLYAETFRIPLFQANRIARLRLLAHDQEELAQDATGNARKKLLERAKGYLTQSYEVLKERVA